MGISRVRNTGRDRSRWMRESLKDESLADEVAAIESERLEQPDNSRNRIAAAIERRYTAPS